MSKPFGNEMRKYGFKGTGFYYYKATEDYLIAVYIEPGRWGGKCTARFAIHPKSITKNYNGKLDLTKLKVYDYEFKMNLTGNARGMWWHYSNDEFTNLVTLNDIIKNIKKRAFSVIEQFTQQPNILDEFQVSDIDNFYDNWTKKTGVFISTVDGQFAWAMMLIFENKDLGKAKDFAKWLLASCDNKTGWYSKDIKRVLNK